MNKKGWLNEGEPHPSAYDAKAYILSLPKIKLELAAEILSSCVPGNKHAEICMETLNRMNTGKPVSDRYILGLAWYIRHIIKIDN